MSPKPAIFNADLPVGAHVKRENGLRWLARVHWTAADYEFVAAEHQRLSQAHADIVAAIFAERQHRFREDRR